MVWHARRNTAVRTLSKEQPMRTPLLSALVAAFSFSAAGCTDNPKPPGTPPPRVELRSAPKVEGPRVKTPPTVAASSGAVDKAQVDAALQVGLAHEDGRSVDHLARAASLHEGGDVKGALAEARRAVFDAPEDEAALERVESLAKVARAHEVRVAALDRIAALRPDDALPLILKARLQVALKDHAGAIRTGALAAKRDANNPEVYQAIGRAHLNLGQLAPAIALFEKVVELDPNHGYALNNLGFAYLRANMDDEAVDVLTRAALLLPRVAYVHNNLGVALERTGRLEEAKQAFSDASFLSPKYVKARVNVARVAALSAPATAQEPAAVGEGDDADVPQMDEGDGTGEEPPFDFDPGE